MKQEQNLLQIIAGNSGRFLSLILLMVIAFAVAYGAEMIAAKRDLKEGKRLRESLRQERWQ